MDLAQARARLSHLDGQGIWRSLDELARTDEFREAVEREFPASVLDLAGEGFSRRNFLRLMGASMALAGVYGCSERPSGKILPYVNPPEQVVPGMPLVFATSMPLSGWGHGVLAESHEGRPTKIEGNPDHPASLGGTNVFMQASVLQLYDPERSRNVTRAGQVSTWQTYLGELTAQLDRKRSVGGRGVRILTGTVTSPTLAAQLHEFLRQFPEARWYWYDPLAPVNAQRGAQSAFGRPVNTVFRFREPEKQVEARVIVSLDADFLWGQPGSLRYSRQFINGRQVRVRHWNQTTMSRLYVIESSMTLTGSMADHRVPARPSEVGSVARAIAHGLGVPGGTGELPAHWTAKYKDTIRALISDLKANQGASLLLAGETQPPEVHALGHAINAALGNVGKTLYYTDPVESRPPGNQSADPYDSLRELTDEMNAGRVDTLLILGDNPAYTAPGDIPFAEALLRLSQPQSASSADYLNFTAHLGLYDDETGFRCQWQLPEAHYLESWGDVRAFDGTASIIQPLIAPMYQGRTAIEVMDTALTPPSQFRFRGGYEIVREYWKSHVKDNFETWWENSVRKGVIENSVAKPIQVPIASAAAPATLPAPGVTLAGGVLPDRTPSTRPVGPEQLEIVFAPDPSVWDGTFTNNGWLQECPRFFTKLVWDNAAIVAPKTAEALAVSNGMKVSFALADKRSVEAPVIILPGQPEGVVTMHLGYGRQRGGSSATEPDGTTPRGFDAYRIRTSTSPWVALGVSHAKTGAFRELVVTHNHFAMDTLKEFGRRDVRGVLKPNAIEDPAMSEEEREIHNRKLVRTTTLQFFNEKDENRWFVRDLGGEAEKKSLLSLYPGWDYSKGYQWGMSIDLQSCIGCNACLVACVAENNIAVVGRDEVARQREMHWIRIDQYFGSSLTEQEIQQGGDPLENPRVYHQPVTCMQCENAPCELVCPVGATAHSTDGINMMVYNRCVGTRYCSNNCPYKVRRFNFFNWMKGGEPAFDLQHNPEVTVRSRGVMEKCTYCVQRTQSTRIEIEKMIVRLEEQIRALEKERPEALVQRQGEIDRQVSDLRRKITQNEFDALENLQTACQQACPTRAIEFGHILPVAVINDNGQKEARLTKVTKLKQEPMDYPLLAELTTVPRTTYMARLRNPNDSLLQPGEKS